MNLAKLLTAFLGCFFICSAIFSQDTIKYSKTCYTNPTTIVAVAAVAHDSAKWDLNNDGIFSDVPGAGDTIIHFFLTADTFPVAVKIFPTTGNGSPYVIMQNVIINPIPQANFIANNYCANKLATFISQSSVASGTISENDYAWDFNNDGVPDYISNDTILHHWSNSTSTQTYTITLTCKSGAGCVASTQKIINVYPNPVAVFSAPSTCSNDSVLLTNTSTVTNLDFYRWIYGDGNQSTSAGNAAHLYSTAGNYTISLIAVTQDGCRDTANVPVVVKAAPSPVIAGASTLCAGENVTLSATGGDNIYIWSSGQTASFVVVSPSVTTLYSVTAVNTNDCSANKSAVVVVNPSPIVNIAANSGTVISPGENVILIANGASNYAWNTGATTNHITVTQSGIYSVTGTDINNCSASDSIVITTKNPDEVAVASGSVLTPNGDGINDALIIDNISNYSNCELLIYNMWNDEIFSVKEYKNDWKGTNSSGADLPAGPYYYIINCDAKPLQKGNINILR